MRRILIVSLVAWALAVSSSGVASASVTTKIHPPPGFGWVGKIVKKDFKKPLGKDNYRTAMCVAQRESNFDPNAYNQKNGASGVFQFIPSTWAWASVQAGYDGASPFDADANIGTAAWVVANYGWSAWGGGCP